MGGGSSSEAKTLVSTKNIVESMTKSIQNCAGNTAINQMVSIIGNYNVVKKVRLVQGLKLSSSCALSDTNVAETQQSVANAIKQQADSQSVSVLGALGKSSSKTESQILNEVKTVINKESIQNIVNNFNATQEFYLNGNSNIVEDITFEQSAQLLHDNCLEAISKIASVQDIQNSSEQVSTAKQTNFVADIVDSVGSIFKTLGLVWVIIAVVGMCVAGYIIVKGGPIAAIFGSPAAPTGPLPNGVPTGPLPTGAAIAASAMQFARPPPPNWAQPNQQFGRPPLTNLQFGTSPLVRLAAQPGVIQSAGQVLSNPRVAQAVGNAFVASQQRPNLPFGPSPVAQILSQPGVIQSAGQVLSNPRVAQAAGRAFAAASQPYRLPIR